MWGYFTFVLLYYFSDPIYNCCEPAAHLIQLKTDSFQFAPKMHFHVPFQWTAIYSITGIILSNEPIMKKKTNLWVYVFANELQSKPSIAQKSHLTPLSSSDILTRHVLFRKIWQSTIIIKMALCSDVVSYWHKAHQFKEWQRTNKGPRCYMNVAVCDLDHL